MCLPSIFHYKQYYNHYINVYNRELYLHQCNYLIL